MTLNFIKKIFGFNKAENIKTNADATSNPSSGNKKIVEQLLSLIINDEYLSTPCPCGKAA